VFDIISRSNRMLVSDPIATAEWYFETTGERVLASAAGLPELEISANKNALKGVTVSDHS
ncbi:MAG: hypothetical protein ACFB3T_03800, partial [Geminicoccaceae bacterium]